MLMMHGVKFNADKVTGTYPKDKDGRDIAPKAYLEHAHNLSARMMSFLAERNEKRAAAKARKRSASGAPSSKAAGNSILAYCKTTTVILSTFLDVICTCLRLDYR
jgi:hypothetical protein